MEKLIAWLQQPSSVAGIAAAAGALAAVASGQMTWEHAAPVLVSAVIAILLPDSTSSRPTGPSPAQTAGTGAH